MREREELRVTKIFCSTERRADLVEERHEFNFRENLFLVQIEMLKKYLGI